MIRAFVSDNSGNIAVLEENNEFGLIRPDLCAPGYGIVSASHTSNDEHIVLNGTSMATPCVTGAVALLLEKNPDLTPAQICEGLETTAVKLADKKNNSTGSGRIDIIATMDFFEDEAKPIISLQEVTIKEITTNENSQIPITLENIGSAPTHNITLELSSDDPYITIINASANFGIISPVQNVTKTFIVTAKADTPDNHIVDFSLTDGYWEEHFSIKVSNSDNISDLNYVFNIYPNPVEDKVIIETDIKIEKVSIYDTYGRLMTTSNGQQTSVDVSNFNNGVYFIKISHDNGEITKLFIKK